MQEIERAMNRMNATEEAKKNKTLEKERMADEVFVTTQTHTQHIRTHTTHTHTKRIYTFMIWSASRERKRQTRSTTHSQKYSL